MNTPKTVDYKELFELDDPLATRPLRLSPIQDWISNKMAFELFTGKFQPAQPVAFKGGMGMCGNIYTSLKVRSPLILVRYI